MACCQGGTIATMVLRRASLLVSPHRSPPQYPYQLISLAVTIPTEPPKDGSANAPDPVTRVRRICGAEQDHELHVLDVELLQTEESVNGRSEIGRDVGGKVRAGKISRRALRDATVVGCGTDVLRSFPDRNDVSSGDDSRRDQRSSVSQRSDSGQRHGSKEASRYASFAFGILTSKRSSTCSPLRIAFSVEWSSFLRVESKTRI